MVTYFAVWYVVIQLITVAALPLTRGLFAALPGLGYAFAKSLGVFSVGVILWLGTSYGILRNDRGGAWLALLLFALASFIIGVPHVRRSWQSGRNGWDVKQVVAAELLFFVAYGAWSLVRLYDPAANHTEQPMDLMFMNSIWTSPDFPPQDAWLSGYAISYYYLGYWLLTTMGHLSSIPPEIAYNLGQASWFGLLLLGCFGIVCNLLALSRRSGLPGSDDAAHGATMSGTVAHQQEINLTDRLGGLLGALAVGVGGNLQIVPEFLHANGVDVTALARMLDVHNFPESASVTGNWYIGYDWWWWRSSRVIQDSDLLGQHIEVIDEFPIFSYILGDNHPHVIAMPIAILAVAMAFNLFSAAMIARRPRLVLAWSATAWSRLMGQVPLRAIGFVAIVAVGGGLIFLNTWDFPPYWLLLAGAFFLATLPSSAHHADDVQSPNLRLPLAGTMVFAVLILMGAVLLYLPYFLTAQSQAGGFLPNLFNPTHFPQFVLMFGAFLPALLALIVAGWAGIGRPKTRTLVVSASLTYGVPVGFLIASAILATATDRGQMILARVQLPQGAVSYLPFIVERWARQPFTFLVVGGMLAFVLALLWRRIIILAQRKSGGTLTFVLLMAAIGLALAYAPEFVYLRDNFGTRMNTVFKFYYQAWMLLGLASAFAIVHSLRGIRHGQGAAPAVLSLFSLLAFGLVMVYPIAGVYSKTVGFTAEVPTLDATQYIASQQPDEWAAIQWFRAHTPPGTRIMEGKGASYWSTYNRISTQTGRPTLLGWDGHEAQWRGRSYADMARGRAEALEMVYRTGSPEEIRRILDEWEILYVYVGPTERSQYGITPEVEARLRAALDPVFEQGSVRIYQR